MREGYSNPHTGCEILNSACVSYIDAGTSDAKAMIAHIEATTSYIEDATAYIKNATDFIEDATYYIAPVQH